MEVRLVESNEELERVVPVMLQLRPAFSPDDLLEQMRLQREKGYQVAFVEKDGEVLCVAGFVIGRKLAWGRHIYIDDLVTNETRRSSGAGREMIKWLENHARETGCDEIHLDSGVQRFGAHRFYLRQGFRISSHHFSLEGIRGKHG